MSRVFDSFAPAKEDVIAAPPDTGDWPAWRRRLTDWREHARASLEFSDVTYVDPVFEWSASCFTSHKIFLWDERFYGRVRDVYLVGEYIDAFEDRFGRLDSVILWHAYPNLGFDARNQFDFYRLMPGGLGGLRDVSDALHERGIRVFLDFNPWDSATRREPGGEESALAELIQALNADGLYLDTMKQGSADLRAAIDRVKPGVVFESQSFAPLDSLQTHQMCWAELYEDGDAPGVLRNKWFERRHMQHLVHRWRHDHAGEIQLAWMNGAGVVVWENVFGSWNGWSERDACYLRLMSAVQHQCSEHFIQGHWTLLIEIDADEVYASTWEHAGECLWTLVNRCDSWQRGVSLATDQPICLDLMSGERLERNPDGVVNIDLPPCGLGGVLGAADPATARRLSAFLESQALAWQSISTDTTNKTHPIELLSPPVTFEPGQTPALSYERRVEYRIRECGLYTGANAPEVSSNALPRLHKMTGFVESVQITPCNIESRPVTNSQFQHFLQDSGYQPAHTERFLHHWCNQAPVKGTGEEPVVWIDLDDARAYAAWVGRWVPAEAEWQYAAEHKRLDFAGPCVWNWTESVRTDTRTRFCLLKGGSSFQARGSSWYADGGHREPWFVAKYLLLWPGLDRSGTIGLRCAYRD